jgi:L-lactate dehydrogenase complex protein LldF
VKHADLAEKFAANPERMAWHDESLWFVRSKRDKAVNTIPEWEELRTRADAIKTHALSRLGDYLVRFEEQAQANGVTVHWAADGDEHNRIILELLQKHGAKKIVKSKSMLTEECHLNPFLEQHGMEVIDTDLGERIVQMRKEPPSHIVMPAIHLKKREIGDLFHEQLNTEAGSEDPQYLTEAARQHLRQKFLNADAGITGVNFAIAETGSVVVCTNEGNADLGTHLPKLHIACMGVEKILPRLEDLGVFTRMLARSATGQPITTYTSHFTRPRPGGEMHIVIVDNGRADQLGREAFRQSLKCIRCGACMNTCPVYRRSGGHSYQFTTPGPIGSVTAPGRDPKKYFSLPFASSLCGSCTDVCPVKIDLHHQLLAWRKELAEKKLIPGSKRFAMKMAGQTLGSSARYRAAGWFLRKVVRRLPKFMMNVKANAWARQREMPDIPADSFRDAWRQRQKDRSNHES